MLLNAACFFIFEIGNSKKFISGNMTEQIKKGLFSNECNEAASNKQFDERYK
jgi:hypothetical protein